MFSRQVSGNGQTFAVTRTPVHLGCPWNQRAVDTTLVQETMLPLKVESPEDRSLKWMKKPTRLLSRSPDILHGQRKLEDAACVNMTTASRPNKFFRFLRVICSFDRYSHIPYSMQRSSYSQENMFRWTYRRY